VRRHCCLSRGALRSEPLTSQAVELSINGDRNGNDESHQPHTYNVPALTEFFCSVFGFQLMEKRADKLSVLRNAEGFLLTLMYDKRMTPEQGYPGMFHVGFLQPTQHAVDLMHDDLSVRNYMAPKPANLQRGGPPTYGFYYDAPGGVTVEVSTMNIAEPA
jgi:hypothetical protein